MAFLCELSIIKSMERLGIHEVMMKSAHLFAERSTCARVKAGSVIAVDRHIVSTGYNGNAPGRDHCDDHFFEFWKKASKFEGTEEQLYQWYTDWKESDEFKKMHHEWAIRNELHGEMNAIIYAARRGISIEGGAIYTTYSPCLFCTKAIIQAGLKEVYYSKLYDKAEGLKSLEVLNENGVLVKQIEV